jgi:hypothetical protein
MAKMSQNPPLAVPVSEGCRLAGIGSSKMYELIGAGTVETTTIGKRRLIIFKSLESLIDAGRSRPRDTRPEWTPPRPRRRRAA